MTATTTRDYAPPLVLALDVGTSSSRAILYDGEGRALEGIESRVAYEMDVTADGGVEIAAGRLLAIVVQTIDGLIARAEALAYEIEAVAACTFWHNLLGIDAEGRAVTPILSWNDTRASATARRLREQMNERELHRRTGCVLHASYWPAKLAWLREHDPEAFKRARKWVSFGEYLYLELFGEAACSVSMASATGLFNQNECGWDQKTLAYLDMSEEHLSPLADMDVRLDRLRPSYLARWPALRQAAWFPVLGDGACSNVGSGCVSASRAALMIGTSGALRVLYKAESVNMPEGLWCYRADRKRFVVGGALSNGGDLFEWMRDTLRLGPVEEVEAQVAAMEPDGHGLTVLPFLSGERSTGWAGEARAAIMGMSLDTTPPEILRAGLESVAYRFAAIYDLLVKESEAPSEIIASGAAVLHSRAWTQIISDVIGKRIYASAESEPSSRGAALMALEALGAIADIEQARAAVGRVHLPDARFHERYLRARKRQQLMYDLLINTNIHKLEAGRK